MITMNDVVILLFNSGETNEVLNILPSLSAIYVTTIAFTSKEGAPLEQKCDLLLLYRYEKEVDPNNLAPTTIALIVPWVGDALGVTLSETMDFGNEDFHVLHPGGVLGEKLEKNQEEARNEEKTIGVRNYCYVNFSTWCLWRQRRRKRFRRW